MDSGLSVHGCIHSVSKSLIQTRALFDAINNSLYMYLFATVTALQYTAQLINNPCLTAVTGGFNHEDIQ